MRNLYAIVQPASLSPKKIGPPDDVELLRVRKGAEDVGAVVGGRVSMDRVRKHDWRMTENDFDRSGSCELV